MSFARWILRIKVLYAGNKVVCVQSGSTFKLNDLTVNKTLTNPILLLRTLNLHVIKPYVVYLYAPIIWTNVGLSKLKLRSFQSAHTVAHITFNKHPLTTVEWLVKNILYDVFFMLLISIVNAAKLVAN